MFLLWQFLAPDNDKEKEKERERRERRWGYRERYNIWAAPELNVTLTRRTKSLSIGNRHKFYNSICKHKWWIYFRPLRILSLSHCHVPYNKGVVIKCAKERRYDLLPQPVWTVLWWLKHVPFCWGNRLYGLDKIQIMTCFLLHKPHTKCSICV